MAMDYLQKLLGGFIVPDRAVLVTEGMVLQLYRLLMDKKLKHSELKIEPPPPPALRECSRPSFYFVLATLAHGVPTHGERRQVDALFKEIEQPRGLYAVFKDVLYSRKTDHPALPPRPRPHRSRGPRRPLRLHPIGVGVTPRPPA